MKYKSLLLSLTWVILYTSDKNEDWILKKDKDGIKVFTRKTSNFKFDELKVECDMEGRLSAFAAVLLDINNHPKWAYKTIKSQVIKSSDSTDIFFYTEIECPWPFENRDVVVHMNLMQNIENKTMTIIAQSENGYLPEKENIVRMKYSKVTWMVTPIDNGHLKIFYKVQIDPGGNVPAWLLNAFASKGPFESFMQLRKEIKMPQYGSAKFSFLKD
ncbi:MAG: hypothetical protein C5B59_07005 [Bacteroidetes bacterium]|nr:MAG: hypothetical protein C5B59_07005 [Bacteroidota bacterium]